MAVGNLVTLEICDDGLHIKLELEGREFLESQIEDRHEEGSDEIFWKRPYSDILWELLEYYECNGGPYLLNQNDYTIIGVLTSAPIIGYDVERDEVSGELRGIGRVFWYPQYAIQSELEDLLNDGETIFEEAK